MQLLLARIAVFVLIESWIVWTLFKGFRDSAIYAGRKGFTGALRYIRRSENPRGFWSQVVTNVVFMILAPLILFVIQI